MAAIGMTPCNAHTLLQALAPFLALNDRLVANRTALMRAFQDGGGLLDGVGSEEILRDPCLPPDATFRHVVASAVDAGLVEKEAPLYWRCDTSRFAGNIAVLSDLANADRWISGINPFSVVPDSIRAQKYAPPHTFLYHEVLFLGAALFSRPQSTLRLKPADRMSSLQELRDSFAANEWPFYCGDSRVKVHSMDASAFTAGAHDFFHFTTWRPCSEDLRKDCLSIHDSLKMFFGDHPISAVKQANLLDLVLSGGNGHQACADPDKFPKEFLGLIGRRLEKHRGAFFEELRRAFASHPRRDLWSRGGSNP